jgi:hypothetical protein
MVIEPGRWRAHSNEIQTANLSMKTGFNALQWVIVAISVECTGALIQSTRFSVLHRDIVSLAECAGGHLAPGR